MANARPPSGGQGETPKATIGFDYSSLQNAPNVARQVAQATTREMTQVFKAAQAESRIILEQERQRTATVKAESQARTVVTRAESQVRIQQARAESIAQQQAARTSSQVAIQEERRKTAAFNAEIKARQRAQASVGQFAGAAIGGLGGPLGAIAGGLAGGTPAIAAGLAVSQGARFAVEEGRVAIAAATNLTESVNKTTVAFAQSDKAILDWSKTSASALGQSQEQALEAASSFGLLFRTTGLAPAESAKMSKVLVQLAADLASINNISPEEALTKLRAGLVGEIEPLRSVGVLLSANAVQAKAFQLGLATSTRDLTEQDKVMARYALILEQTTLQQGDFARTSGDAANLQRILTAETADFNAQLGETLLPAYVLGLQGATVAVRALGVVLESEQNKIEFYAQAWEKIARSINQIRGVELPTVQGGPSWRGGAWAGGGESAGFGGGGGSGGFGGGSSADLAAAEAQQRAQQSIIVDRYQSLAQVQRDADRAIVESAAQFAQQRSQTIASYEKSIAREAEDFGRQRLNAEVKLGMSILNVAQDSARQRMRWEADLARTLQEQRAEADERIADARGASAERIGEIEQQYNKDREKRQRDFAKNIRDAAANLDAVQVRELQRQRREDNQDAKDAHAEQIADEQASLQKRIDEANKAYVKQEQQQRDTLQRRIDQQREDDALRIEEMKAAFAAQTAQEDIERGIRLARQAEDHDVQLIEMDRAQVERIQQIKDHAADERDQINEEHQARLAEVGIQTNAWIREQELLVNAAVASHRRFWEELNKPQIGPNGQPAGFPSLAAPFQYVPPVPSVSAPSVSNRSVNNSRAVNVTINVPGGTSLNEQQLYDIAYRAVADVLESNPQ